MSEALRAAQALVREARAACLATFDPATGTPFASLVAVALDDAGRPVLLLSHLAEHTRNLVAQPRASLLFASSLDGASMDVPRVTLSGAVRWLEGAEAEVARARLVDTHSDARQWATLPGFRALVLEVERVRSVAGFGRAVSYDGPQWLGP